MLVVSANAIWLVLTRRPCPDGPICDQLQPGCQRSGATEGRSAQRARFSLELVGRPANWPNSTDPWRCVNMYTTSCGWERADLLPVVVGAEFFQKQTGVLRAEESKSETSARNLLSRQSLAYASGWCDVAGQIEAGGERILIWLVIPSTHVWRFP